jgi:membrane fusion protein (multidrug efflux system)
MTSAPRPPADADAPAAPKAKSRLPLIIVAVLVIAGGTWGVKTWLHSRAHVSTDNAQVDGHITVIAPKVQAFVDRVLVDDNAHVKAGDTLVVLDDRDLKVRLQQAEADLASARATAGFGRQIGQTGAQLLATRAQAGGADASVISAEAMLTKAKADLDRYRGLAEKKIIAAQQLDAAQATYDAAVANLDAARKQASAAVSQVAAGSAAVSGANARLASAQTTVETARLNLSYTVITAPIAGIVAKRNAESGALVNVGTSLMSIVPDSAVWVTANLKETELADVKVGQPASFSVDAYPGKTFTGKVESLSPATGARFALLPPDNATGNFTKVVQRLPVRIAVDRPIDPATPLRPGMSVVADIRVK